MGERAARRAWIAWLVVGLLVTAGYLLLPAGSGWANAVYDVLGSASVIAIVVTVRRRRPPQGRLWYWMAAGQALSLAGDLIYTLYESVLHRPPFPSPADVCYLAAYPLLSVGLVVLIRARQGGQDPAGPLDAGIVVTGLGLLSWTFLIRPVLAEADAPLTTRVVSVSYPVADVLIIAMVAWLLTTTGARTLSYRLLVAAMLCLLAADMAFSALTTFANYEGGVTDAGWLLSYVLWAAAALHPSMPGLCRPAPRAVAVGRLRLASLATAMLIAPTVLLVEGVIDPARVDWLGAGVGGVLLCLLALARFTHLLGRMVRLALHDDLTGLGNRRLLEQRLGELSDGPAQLVVLDLRGFQQINDRLGRSTGDQLLCAVATRLRGAVRPSDLVARIGGDKFALLLAGTTDADADARTADLRARLNVPLPAGGDRLLVDASAGVTTAEAGVAATELLRRADVALHAARQVDAGGQTRYEPRLDDDVDEQARLGAALRTALDEDQFTLYYQPIVTLPDGRLAGVEALVRWRHPTAGLTHPTMFVPLAERNGLIVELGRWVLREACRQMVRWDARLGARAPARISVNVSARQLVEPGFVDLVAETLARTGLAAGRLIVEVTETAVFGGGTAVAALRAIHDLGVRVALDDFGTGHSSLALLRDCPVDLLKVDKSFIDHITHAGQHAVIATALVHISAGLQLTAIAEGVETAAQAEELHRLGYRYAQGYHFGRPVPPEALHRPQVSAAVTGRTLAA